MISMTGYAFREKTERDFSISIELKGYNSRFLDININLPPWLSSLEMKIREKISSSCGRGKIDVFIRIREYNSQLKITVNANAAKAYYDVINNLSTELGINEKPGLTELLNMEGILETEKNRDEELYWQTIQPLLHEALESFNLERAREGKHTEKDIIENLDKLESSLKIIESFTPAIEQSVRDNIRTRFNEVLGNQIDENRILTEIATLLVKNTVSEEISRLSSHLGEFRAEAARNIKPGKKLDFLCQEINREINTIGSKSIIFDVNTEVVKMKESLENIREQLRNIE